MVMTNENSNSAFDSTYHAFVRADGTPISGYTAWGPKIKANPFGPGIGMGAVAFSLGVEVPELAPVNETPGDFPAVQLFNNDGSRASPAISDCWPVMIITPRAAVVTATGATPSCP